MEIVCSTCYVKGNVTAELLIDDNFNATQAIDQTLDEVKEEVHNFTEQVDDYLKDYFRGVISNLDDGFQTSDLIFPTFNYSFSMDIATIPECHLKVQFDDLELYMQTNTILSLGSTYELNLYSSNTPVGISITKDLELGIIFAIDLILSVNGEVDISSGFHIRLDDGLAIDIALFSDEVSDIIL